MRSRINTGSVVQDKRDKVWRFYWWENGKRHSKALGRFTRKQPHGRPQSHCGKNGIPRRRAKPSATPT